MDDFAAGLAMMVVFLAVTALSIFFAVVVSVYGLLALTGARRLTRYRIVNGVIAVACGVLFAHVALSTSLQVPLLYSYVSVGALVLMTLFIAVLKMRRLKERSTRDVASTAHLSSQWRAALGVSLSCVASLLILAALPTYLIVAPKVESAENDKVQEQVLEGSPLESVYDIDRTQLASVNNAEFAANQSDQLLESA